MDPDLWSAAGSVSATPLWQERSDGRVLCVRWPPVAPLLPKRCRRYALPPHSIVSEKPHLNRARMALVPRLHRGTPLSSQFHCAPARRAVPGGAAADFWSAAGSAAPRRFRTARRVRSLQGRRCPTRPRTIPKAAWRCRFPPHSKSGAARWSRADQRVTKGSFLTRNAAAKRGDGAWLAIVREAG